ncbi:unnamed protein product [Closterium sp. Yama58-4]|nr:unnamed protein product [Closterium sp. Yama58-4]
MEDAMPAGGWTDAEATGAGASSRPDGAGDAQASQCDGRRLRFFDHAMRKACWEKADVVPGRHPDRWRVDAAGNTVGRRFNACQGCLCYEFDHIVPFSKGGATSVENCQLLQTRVNRFKSDKDQLSPQEYAHASCHLTLTDRDLDLVEMAVYGDVVRPGLQCRVTTVAEAMGVLPPAARRRPSKPHQQYGACHWPGAASEEAQGSLP